MAAFVGSLRGLMGLCCAAGLAGCGTFPFNEEEARVEISKVKGAIECELAAVARDKRFAGRRIPEWDVKVSLDLTLVTQAGIDGTVTVLLPHTASQVALTPSGDLGRKDTSIAHLEFSISIAKAMKDFPDCRPGPDPSATAMGLAAWFDAALVAIDNKSNGGLSYTTEFEVAGNAGVRFGYTLLRLITSPNITTAGAGGRAGMLGNHRLTVALAPPAPPLRDARVFVTNWPSSEPGAASVRSPSRAAPPAVDDSRLNRLLDQQRPIRLQPGSR